MQENFKDFLFNGLIDHSDKTLFKDIYQLEPGNFLKIKSTGEIQKKKYWNLKDKVNQLSDDLKNKNNDYLSKKYQSLLKDSLNLQIRSDVELGTTLSSGFDSSMITYMVKKKIDNLKTFTYGLAGKKDETFYAKKVLKLLNLKISSIKLNETEIEEYLKKVIYLQKLNYLN